MIWITENFCTICLFYFEFQIDIEADRAKDVNTIDYQELNN